MNNVCVLICRYEYADVFYILKKYGILTDCENLLFVIR